LLKLVESWGELDETLKPSAQELLEHEAWCHVSWGLAGALCWCVMVV
jgi:hypothetical protein